MRREPPALDVHASRTQGDTSGPARRLPVHWFTETQVIPLVDLGNLGRGSSQRLPALKTTRLTWVEAICDAWALSCAGNRQA